ncbi:MAG: electron transfer flavoprotein subunit alpha/FixB family protein [Anaerolineae bacterium]|jgi:electron transfer flavoprotein alpha subunit
MDASYLDLMMAQQDETFEPAAEAEGGGGVWVVADLRDDGVAPVTLEAIGAARTLADSLGAYVYAVLLGSEVAPLAQTLYQAGADGVRVGPLKVDSRTASPSAVEPHLEILSHLFEKEQPEIVLLGATEIGQALAPRLAQRTGGGLIEHVTAMTLDETRRAVEAAFPVYGGEYFDIRVCPSARPQFLTVEPGAFGVPFLDEYRTGEPTTIEVEPARPAVRLVGLAEDFDPPPTPLAQEPVIVSVGRRVRDFGLVERLAEVVEAQLAGDRGAWDAGLVDAEQVVDVRGVSVSPDVYVAVGIRGDTFHNAAIEGARFIVAIHPDPNVSMFEIADLCVEAEPEQVLPALLDALT